MSQSRQPWPMKWIALIILLIIGPYTFLRWHYRKPNPAFQPYHDIKDQANTQRLLSAGFQRITVSAERPAEPMKIATPASVAPAAGGLPSSLEGTLVDQPLLPREILTVTAASRSSTMFAYPVEFTCSFADNKQQLNGASVYLRDGEMFIVPNFERLSGELLARTRESTVRITLPPGSVKPGTYQVTLIGQQSSRSWPLTVK